MSYNKLTAKRNLRILKFYRMLTQCHIETFACIQFISEIFHLSESYVVRIIKTKKESDYADVILIHCDIDKMIVEAYFKKLFKESGIKPEVKPKNQH